MHYNNYKEYIKNINSNIDLFVMLFKRNINDNNDL